MNQSVSRILVFFALLTYGWRTPVIAQTYTLETVPNPKQNQSAHYVSNPDHMLSDVAVNQIDHVLGRLEDSTTAQVAVVCVNSIGENVPKDFATALFRKWGLGYRQKNNGLLILLVKDQHRIEMETGYGLEGILPDAICRRIQTQKMIPLAKVGNFDGAIIDGVQEIARLISTPEAANEVYDNSKFTTSSNQPLTNSGLLVLFMLLTPALLVLRLLAYFLRKRNPIAKQIETAVAKSKGRLAWAFLLYVIMPVGIGFVVIQLRQPLSLHGWQILLVMYAYASAVVWDARRRRKNTFTTLFGSLTGPARYVHQKAAGLNNWGTLLLFPIPLAWLKKQDDQALDALRNHRRTSADGYELTNVEDALKPTFLTDYQKTEQRLGTVDYDVWRNEVHDITQAVGYENLSDTTYQCCTKCGSKAMHLANKRIVKKATVEREGRGINEYECLACGHHAETQYSIATVQRDTPSPSYSSTTFSSSGSSSSSWGGSSGSSSSSSNWGGGRSGGGGAGSSW